MTVTPDAFTPLRNRPQFACTVLFLVFAAGGFSQAPPPAGAKVVPGDRFPQPQVEFASGVVCLTDVTYAAINGFRPLTLDLYLPPANAAAGTVGRPVVVFVHGGSWKNGNARYVGAVDNWPGVLASLSAKGFVVASLNYRLSGEAPFPAAIQDVKSAIQWLRSKSATYSIDKGRVMIWGASAGGILAALAATSSGVAALAPAAAPSAGRATRPPAPVESDQVQGAVIWYGIIDFEALGKQSGHDSKVNLNDPTSDEAKFLGGPVSAVPAVAHAASPFNYIGPSTPPFLLLAGSEDDITPGSQEFYDKLKANGVKAELVIVPGTKHFFVGATPEITRAANLAALEKTFAFFDATVGGTK